MEHQGGGMWCTVTVSDSLLPHVLSHHHIKRFMRACFPSCPFSYGLPALLHPFPQEEEKEEERVWGRGESGL